MSNADASARSFAAGERPAPGASVDDVDSRLVALLQEDAPFGDLTTSSLRLAGEPAEVIFMARGPMAVCGIEEAARLFELCGATVQIRVRTGETVAGEDTLLTARGDAAGLLMAWKTAQTLAEALSGIATAARLIVDAVKAAGFDVPLACTRKNFPGTRFWVAKAVRAGGGVMHRLGLSETLLVFPEHRSFIEPARQAAAIRSLRRAQPEKRVVVEVGSFEDAIAMAQAGADVLQLERFTPAQLQALRASLSSLSLTPMLAPAGGVTLANAVEFARAGADFLVSSSPYFAPPADIRVVLRPPVD